MLRHRKLGASVGALALAAGTAGLGAIVLAAPSAYAADPPNSMRCNSFSNSAGFATTWASTNTFAISPASVAPGGTVTATWTSTGFVNASPTTLNQGTVQVQVLVAVSGTQTGNIVAVTQPNTYPASDIASGDNLGGFTATTSFTASNTPGPLNYTVKQVLFKSVDTSGAQTYCSPFQGSAGPPATGNFPAAGDPLITSTLLPGYTPNFQTNFDEGKVSGTATTVATTSNAIVAGSTETATAPPTQTAPPTTTPPSTTPPPTTSASATTTPTPTSTVNNKPRSASATSKAYCDVSNVGLGALSEYQFPMTVTVSPGAAPPGDVVGVSVAVNKSPTNIGPSTIDAGEYRMEATIGFDGKSIQLLGPKNQGQVAPEVGAIFAADELPTVAKGTITLPDSEGEYPITIKDIWYNNGNNGTTGSFDKTTDLFDQRCNASTSPQSAPKAFAAPTVKAAANADAPPSTEEPTDDSTDDTDTGGDGESGGLLAATGPRETIVLGLLALLALQLGAIFTVRAVRASPKGPRHL